MHPNSEGDIRRSLARFNEEVSKQLERTVRVTDLCDAEHRAQPGELARAESRRGQERHHCRAVEHRMGLRPREPRYSPSWVLVRPHPTLTAVHNTDWVMVTTICTEKRHARWKIWREET